MLLPSGQDLVSVMVKKNQHFMMFVSYPKDIMRTDRERSFLGKNKTC